jgi:positive regulator of sigma E activity
MKMSQMPISQALIAAAFSFVVLLLLEMFLFAGAVKWLTVFGISIGIGLGFFLVGLYRHQREKSQNR